MTREPESKPNIGDSALTQTIIEEAKNRRIAVQIGPDGTGQKPWEYTQLNPLGLGDYLIPR